MPRANRYILPGYLYHVTHRCHDRKFLFNSAAARTEYRRRLAAGLERFNVSLLGYAITSNHTHQILMSEETSAISLMIQSVDGKFAEYYNAVKGRRGAFWEDRFHAIMIEEGSHLFRCMAYIDLNMVRAGAVKHPAEWDWCSYRELTGERRRYRLVDREALLKLLGPLADDFHEAYKQEIESAIASNRLLREPWWTESIAAGSKEFVQNIEQATRKRKKRIRCEESGDGCWYIREDPVPYQHAAHED
jgi:putative transposase